MNTSGGSLKVIIVALGANLAIALAKFVGAFFSGSASLLAEAVHSVVDSTNQALLIVGEKAAQKPPTETHPLGYGRASFFWSFIVTILLFSLGGLFAIYEGAHKLSHPEAMENPWLALGILAMSLALETYSFYTCLQEVRARNTHGSLLRWFRKTTSAGLLVLFTEDAGAIFGLFIAAVCVTLAWLTHNPAWDACGSILVGVLLVVLAFFLAGEIKSLIIGETPSTDYRTDIESFVQGKIPGGRILKFLALQLGDKEVMVSYKISPGKITDVGRLIDAINEIERLSKSRWPEIKWQFVEPDNKE